MHTLGPTPPAILTDGLTLPGRIRHVGNRHPQGTCTFKLPTNDGGLSLAAALQHFIQEQTGIPVDEQERESN